MISLRLVLDTNIVVSAALRPDGIQRTILLLALCRPAKLYVSPPIVEEYRCVLSRAKLRIPRGAQRQLLQIIANSARIVCPVRRLQVATDLGDNIFLECADVARADYLIAGNLPHFPRFWKQTKIVTTREFLSLVTPHLVS